MTSRRSSGTSGGASLSLKTGNKKRRQELFVQDKKARGKERHEMRHRRRRAEAQDPTLRAARLEKRKQLTLDDKRVWDNVDDDSLGVQVDLAQLKRRRIAAEEAAEREALEVNNDEEQGDDDNDSMLDSESEGEDDEDDEDGTKADSLDYKKKRPTHREDSLAPSTTSTNLDLTPSSLMRQFPHLFNDEPIPEPKILVTTSLNSTLHEQAQVLCGLFPNSHYVRRTEHRHAHKYSLREIAQFASNRDYTAVLLLHEESKQPTRLSVCICPTGPTLHFSITPGSWLDGKKIPGHGTAQAVFPELLATNFCTPLGFLVAAVFQRLFPPRPDLSYRQVVSLTNKRDYVFLRRHRYVFRDKRPGEKAIVGADGKEIKEVEGIRVGLQELGPRFCLKLRRVDKGVGRAGSHGEDATPWEWKPSMEKDRKRFNL